MPETEPEDVPPPSGWKRYKLPVHRKDRVGRAASAPAEPSAKPKRGLRALLITVGLVVVLPIAGCLFLFALLALGVR